MYSQTAQSPLPHSTATTQGKHFMPFNRHTVERRPLTALRYANAIDNDLGDGTNTAPVGDLTASSMPYSYTLLGSANVVSTVVDAAGAILSF